MIRETTYCIIRKNAGGAMLTAGIFISALLLAASSCTKTEVSGDEGTDKDGCIAFYLNAHPTKAIIEDTEKLYELAPPIYVTENLRLTDFNNTMIEFTGNGVWRSDVEWASGNLDYSFYAYTYSLGRGTISSMVGNGAVANNGKTVLAFDRDPVSHRFRVGAIDFVCSRISLLIGAVGQRQLPVRRPAVQVDFFCRIQCAAPALTVSNRLSVFAALHGSHDPAVILNMRNPAAASGQKEYKQNQQHDDFFHWHHSPYFLRVL